MDIFCIYNLFFCKMYKRITCITLASTSQTITVATPELGKYYSPFSPSKKKGDKKEKIQYKRF